MTNIFIIYPNTLFDILNIIDDIKSNNIKYIYIIEDDMFFKKYKFHKQKIILHRASMKYYYDCLLLEFGTIVNYIDNINIDKFYKNILKKNYHIFCYDMINHKIINKLKKNFSFVTILDNLSFMETYEDLQNYNNTVKNNKYIHDHFYKWNRTRLNILLDNNSKPLFNKWSFDTDNRKPFDNNYNEYPFYPNNYLTKYQEYINEAKEYVLNNFNSNFGEIDEFFYPICHSQALQLLKHFLKNKIHTFGIYQDAVSKDIIIGSHSCLSSSLNIGLITTNKILKETLKSFYKLTISNQKKLINNYEGFIRQLIGWRSYTRLLYEFNGNKMYQMNFLNHHKKITNKWYNGDTNIYPIDILINKVKKYAYLHHIERLMYIGNWALLAEIHPKEIYKWFMITCIDSYEWVMIPNVHGMSQHALDNQIVSMMTRPYFSSTNYLKNMSDLVIKTEEWTTIWNNLYYYFIYKNTKYLKSNYATSRQVKHWDDKSNYEQTKIINNAIEYLKIS